ncbi:tyrosine-type recombinase/integrase [Azospirillum doebereinerae]
MVIDQYIKYYGGEIGRTKAQVLRSIKAFELAEKPISTIESANIVAMLRGMDVKPQTRGNYLSHLAAVISTARPAWGHDVDPAVVRDAAIAAKRLKLVTKSQQRQRRPTLDELDKLMRHFGDRERRRPSMLPMTRVIPFALFSTRRLEEITRIRWADLDVKNSRVLVRDMKNPGEKAGNDIWCDLPAPALKFATSMPRIVDKKNGKEKEEIFPYSTDAIGANFTRACLFLGINTEDMPDEDRLYFHDLRHEGASRLFEMGLNIPHVAAVTGHRSWTSLKRYTHIRDAGDKYESWEWLKIADEPYRPKRS